VSAEHRIALHELWQVLPTPARQKTLQTLGRMMAQRLSASLRRQEQTHERH
jgi:hypothetical protein